MFTRDTTKRIITVITVTAIALLVSGYSYFASHNLIQGPTIAILTPKESSFATSSVEIKGVAQRVNSITLDDRPIFIDEQGNFDETVLLALGYNVVSIEGQDKFGKKTDLTLQFYRNLNSF